MSVNERIEAINKAITIYSKAYNTLEGLQQSEAKLPDQLIPIGDQKTGSIGEFYAMRYLLAKNPGADVILKPASNHQIDIDVTVKDTTKTIQVKTVSRHSKTRTISPLHGGYDELHLILLDEDFIVDHYWITKDVIIGQSLRMPDPDQGRKGSAKLTSLIPLSSAELIALREKNKPTIRYRAKDAVISKLKQVRYVYFKRVKSYQGKVIVRGGLNQEYDCYPLNIDLGCFLTQCRSVLQYIRKEAEYKPEMLKLYNDYLGRTKVLSFFRDLRNAEIHAAPGGHQVQITMDSVILPMHIRNEQELREWQEQHGRTSPRKAEIVYRLRKMIIPDDVLYDKLKNEGRDDLLRAIEEGKNLYEEQELEGEGDLFILCEKYLKEIENFVDYCCNKGIIS